MKHISRLSIALLLVPFFSMAQSNYKPGSVVNLKGDTIRGFIDYRGWDSNPTEISFKSSLSYDKAQKFTIDEITAFKIDGIGTYKKFTCKISMDQVNTNHLGEGRDTSNRTDLVFLQMLQQGKNVALYSYTDAIKTRFYIATAPDYKPAELGYRIYIDNGKTIIENNYQKQLFAIGNQFNVLDENLIDAIQKADYSQQDILAIVSRINNISASDYKHNYYEAERLRFYFGAGANFTANKSNTSSPYAMGGGPGYLSTGAEIVAGLSIIPNPKIDHSEIHLDLLIAQVPFNVKYQLTVYPDGAYKASFNELDFSLAPYFTYNLYNADNFKFFIGAGIAATYSTFSNPYFGSINGSGVNGEAAATDYYNFDHFNIAVLLKGGFRVSKKYEIFFNYLTNSVTAGGGYFALDNTRYQAGIAYYFGK